MTKAVDVGFSRATGEQGLDELNALLADGWTVVLTEQSGGGNLLVIVEKQEQQRENQI